MLSFSWETVVMGISYDPDIVSFLDWDTTSALSARKSKYFGFRPMWRCA